MGGLRQNTAVGALREEPAAAELLRYFRAGRRPRVPRSPGANEFAAPKFEGSSVPAFHCDRGKSMIFSDLRMGHLHVRTPVSVPPFHEGGVPAFRCGRGMLSLAIGDCMHDVRRR